jgi:hypothetical protein
MAEDCRAVVVKGSKNICSKQQTARKTAGDTPRQRGAAGTRLNPGEEAADG